MQNRLLNYHNLFCLTFIFR